MKCSQCKQEIPETFLKKIVGTYVGRGKSKKAVCSQCQKKLAEATPPA